MDCSMPGFLVLHYLLELTQNSYPLSRWCYPIILSFVIPFSSCPQSFITIFSGELSPQQLAKVLELQFQHQSFQLIFRVDSLAKRLSRVFSNPTIQKHHFFGAQLSLWSNSHIHAWLLKKNIALSSQTFVSKVMSLLLNMLSRLAIAFLPRSRHLLISWLQSPSAVILEPKKIKSLTVFHCFPIYLPWSDGTRCHDLSFLNVEF